MPIALFVAPQVEEIICSKFGKDFISLRDTSVWNQDSNSELNADYLVVQLDVQPDKFDKGSLPGLHWLEDEFSAGRIKTSTSIIITSWDHDIFAPNSAVRFRIKVGAHPRSNLLYSPLVEFIPLTQLLRLNSRERFEGAFPTIELSKIRHPERLFEDIASNCYTQLGIGSRCHRLRHMVVDYWQLQPNPTSDAVYRRFHKDITEVHKVVLQNAPRRELIINIEKQVEYHIQAIRQSSNLEAFLQCFNHLESLLVQLERHQHVDVEPLSMAIILISRDPHFAQRLRDQLSARWGVECSWVQTLEDALALLSEAPNRYACLLSNFRNNQSNGKMDYVQGYENLYAVEERYPWIQCAFLTSMRGARWELPGELNWWFFEKQELTDLNQKSAHAFYFFLREAEAKRRGRVLRVPDKLLQGRKVFRDMKLPGMPERAYSYLEGELERARACVRAYCEGKSCDYGWRVSTRYRENDTHFLFDRLFFRLVILAMFRQNHLISGPAPKEEKTRRTTVFESLWPGQTGKGPACADFLRISQKDNYQVPLQELYQKDLLFYHELILLPRLIILQSTLTPST